ncbi:enoyl-CoA hydratase/isomerase family protein [Thalassorhabdus alkalitolerans]|uniref:Enoyl-CoA hydratase/isomerase family protein n=1 Tax=Thalassorhabdus alkalitolerans TaxID=2282697 RepID=A0ABW0YIY0_9BACI|nr:enoyl-CoA hydratase [Thalassobacillus sp. C254]
MSNHLLVEERQGVMYVTLNRPERLNAFSPDMMEGLLQALSEAEEKSEVKAIVLSGAGRSFSAGGDVKSMGEATPAKVYSHIERLNEVIKKIKRVEKPIIAAVHGFAAGAGFNLALACDLIVSSKDSKFAMSFGQVGLISDGGGSYFLPKLVGIHRAKEIMFSGEAIEAERAYEIGIVNQLFDPDEMKEKTESYAARIARGPIGAYGMMKKVMDHSLNASLEEILQEERISQTLMVASEDHKEGVQAFVEKRAPSFSGS